MAIKVSKRKTWAAPEVITAAKLNDTGTPIVSDYDCLNISVAKAQSYSASTTGDQFSVAGYTTAGDAGGGVLYVDKADTTTAENGVTVFVASDGTRLKRTITDFITPQMAGAKGDGSTVDDTALQAALSAGYPIVIPKGSSHYRLTSRLTAPANTHIKLERGAELKWTATDVTGSTLLGSVTRPGIEVTGDNFILEGEGTITGPSTTYVTGEIGVWMKGTSTSARKNKLTVAFGVEFKNWGYGGVVAQFVDNIIMQNCSVHDGAESGAMFFSCDSGVFQNNQIHDIAPDSAVQCYGISLTHDSVNYHVDQTINPFCRRWDISFNEIWNLPDWQGIDAHGAYEVSAHHNKVYNCCLGISISGSSGDATPYGGANNEISFNTITIKKRDGSATSVTATARTGINISGGSTVSAKGCRAVGNYIEGYGDTTQNSDSIRALYCDDAIITENIISSWKGRGIHAANSSGVISNNTFGAVASDTNSSCVFLDTTTGKYTITGNKHALASGTGASIGIRINDAANPRSIISANDFSSATALTSGVDGTSTAGNSEITPRIDVSGAPATLDVSASRAAKEVWIFASLSSPTSYGDIIGAVIGQKITICDTGSNAITFTRANAALAGGANWVSTQYDALTLLCINTSGTKFIELHRSANS